MCKDDYLGRYHFMFVPTLNSASSANCISAFFRILWWKIDDANEAMTELKGYEK
jgi:hypothetical protein